MAKGSDVVVKRKLFVDPVTALFIWRTYNKAFSALNIKSPCRQSFHFFEFIKVFADPDFVKFFLRVDGDIVGMAVYTMSLDKLPWINSAYFAHAYPGKTVAYIPIIAVSPSYQGFGYASPLMKALDAECIQDGIGRLCFDHSDKLNAVLPKLIVKCLSDTGVVFDSVLDQQVYVALKREV